MKNKVKDIVREARGEQSQKEFATYIRKSQGLLSKYELGLVNPPSDVINKCIKILDARSSSINSNHLGERIKRELKGQEYDYIRKTIITILDSLNAKKA